MRRLPAAGDWTAELSAAPILAACETCPLKHTDVHSNRSRTSKPSSPDAPHLLESSAEAVLHIDPCLETVQPSRADAGQLAICSCGPTEEGSMRAGDAEISVIGHGTRTPHSNSNRLQSIDGEEAKLTWSPGTETATPGSSL